MDGERVGCLHCVGLTANSRQKPELDKQYKNSAIVKLQQIIRVKSQNIAAFLVSIRFHLYISFVQLELLKLL